MRNLLSRLFVTKTQTEITKHYQAAQKCMKLGQWKEAKENLLKVIELYPNCMSAHYTLYEVKKLQQDQDKAAHISDNPSPPKLK